MSEALFIAFIQQVESGHIPLTDVFKVVLNFRRKLRSLKNLTKKDFRGRGDATQITTLRHHYDIPLGAKDFAPPMLVNLLRRGKHRALLQKVSLSPC
jgi:hypothetical protein